MSKSALEARFERAWRALAPPDAPQPVREHRFHPTRRWRFDFAWPEEKVAVEIDGGQWKRHGGRHARDSDREKSNGAILKGWKVLHYSGSMLHDPTAVVDEVLTVLYQGDMDTRKKRGVAHTTRD